METMSKYFKLDNGKSFWQSGIYRKQESTTTTLCLKTKPQGVTLMIKKLSNAHHRKEMHYYE